MATLEYSDAERISDKRRPWTFRMELLDSYWYATGRAQDEMVEVAEGALGGTPETKLVPWDHLVALVQENLDEGYAYVRTPFIRMSAESLAKLGITAPATPPPVKNVSSARPTKRAKPVPSVAVPQRDTTKAAAQEALGKPQSLIAALRVVRVGTVLKAFKAVDKDGKPIMDFTVHQGRQFAIDYDLDFEWR